MYKLLIPVLLLVAIVVVSGCTGSQPTPTKDTKCTSFKSGATCDLFAPGYYFNSQTNQCEYTGAGSIGDDSCAPPPFATSQECQQVCLGVAKTPKLQIGDQAIFDSCMDEYKNMPNSSYSPGGIILIFNIEYPREDANSFLKSIGEPEIFDTAKADTLLLKRLNGEKWEDFDEADAAAADLAGKWKDLGVTNAGSASDGVKGSKYHIVLDFATPKDTNVLKDRARKDGYEVMSSVYSGDPSSWVGVYLLGVDNGKEIESICQIRSMQIPVVDHAGPNLLTGLLAPVKINRVI